MKKYKSGKGIIAEWQDNLNLPKNYAVTIFLDHWVTIEIESRRKLFFHSKKSAKRAAERVAKKLNISLIWEE